MLITLSSTSRRRERGALWSDVVVGGGMDGSGDSSFCMGSSAILLTSAG